jgi:hypothetical protein
MGAVLQFQMHLKEILDLSIQFILKIIVYLIKNLEFCFKEHFHKIVLDKLLTRRIISRANLWKI